MGAPKPLFMLPPLKLTDLFRFLHVGPLCAALFFPAFHPSISMFALLLFPSALCPTRLFKVAVVWVVTVVVVQLSALSCWLLSVSVLPLKVVCLVASYLHRPPFQQSHRPQHGQHFILIAFQRDNHHRYLGLHQIPNSKRLRSYDLVPLDLVLVSRFPPYRVFFFLLTSLSR